LLIISRIPTQIPSGKDMQQPSGGAYHRAGERYDKRCRRVVDYQPDSYTNT
jgi:hypothetical protein